jgi:hypothetical protein
LTLWTNAKQRTGEISFDQPQNFHNIWKDSARSFVTGRLNMKLPIETALSTSPRSITLEANAEDIRKYVSHQLDMDDHHGDMDESFRQEIMDRIVETADGMLGVETP